MVLPGKYATYVNFAKTEDGECSFIFITASPHPTKLSELCMRKQLKP